MSATTFSVITAVRNGLTDLQRTSASLQAQTSQDFEWIVIDAASNDGTADWLSTLKVFGDRLHWVSEPDRGISDAWNKGLAIASGHQVMFLNAGDVYDPLLIERFAGAIGCDYVTCCHARLLSEDGSPLGLFAARPRLLWRGMHLPHNWASVPRSLYEEYGGYKLIPHSMDFEWFHRYFKARGVEGFKLLDDTLGSYRMGGHSDQNFREGFAANAKILVSRGMPRPFAAMLQIIYLLKHLIRHR